MNGIPTTEKPCAAKGLISYRYKGTFGWIMIGATSHADALSEANRSLSKPNAQMSNLQVWDGKQYVPAKKNRISLGCTYHRHLRLGVHAVVNARAGQQDLNNESQEDIELARDARAIRDHINNRGPLLSVQQQIFPPQYSPGQASPLQL